MAFESIFCSKGQTFEVRPASFLGGKKHFGSMQPTSFKMQTNCTKRIDNVNTFFSQSTVASDVTTPSRAEQYAIVDRLFGMGKIKAHLRDYLKARIRYSNNHGVSTVSKQAIASYLHVSVRSITNYERTLCSMGWISKTNHDGWNKNNTIEFYDLITGKVTDISCAQEETRSPYIHRSSLSIDYKNTKDKNSVIVLNNSYSEYEKLMASRGLQYKKAGKKQTQKWHSSTKQSTEAEINYILSMQMKKEQASRDVITMHNQYAQDAAPINDKIMAMIAQARQLLQ